MMVVHEAMKTVVVSLQKPELSGFLVMIRELVERKCVPLLMLYCCNIFEFKDVWVVHHIVAINRS